MDRTIKFNEIFGNSNIVATDEIWKKIGDNYTQYCISQTSSYRTETSCNLKS